MLADEECRATPLLDGSADADDDQHVTCSCEGNCDREWATSIAPHADAASPTVITVGTEEPEEETSKTEPACAARLPTTEPDASDAAQLTSYRDEPTSIASTAAEGEGAPACRERDSRR